MHCLCSQNTIPYKHKYSISRLFAVKFPKYAY